MIICTVLFKFRITLLLAISQNITSSSTLLVDIICNYPRKIAYFIDELYIHVLPPLNPFIHELYNQ